MNLQTQNQFPTRKVDVCCKGTKSFSFYSNALKSNNQVNEVIKKVNKSSYCIGVILSSIVPALTPYSNLQCNYARISPFVTQISTGRFGTSPKAITIIIFPGTTYSEGEQLSDLAIPHGR